MKHVQLMNHDAIHVNNWYESANVIIYCILLEYYNVLHENSWYESAKVIIYYIWIRSTMNIFSHRVKVSHPLYKI